LAITLKEVRKIHSKGSTRGIRAYRETLSSIGSSSSTQNVAFVSTDSTSSTNEVNIAYDVSTSFGHNSKRGGSSSYADELMYSFFATQSSGLKLDHEDLEQLDEFDLEEMNLKWRPVKQDEPMVTIDGEGVNWTGHAKDNTEDYALMAFNSSNSGSDTEVTSCSKECENTYAKLKKLYDEQREKLELMPSFNLILRAFASLGHDLSRQFWGLDFGNSNIYDPNPNSFDCPPDSYHPSHPTYETYSYDSYGNNSQFGYDCQPQFPLNYESEPGYIENYNSYPYDSSSVPQQYPCTRCGEMEDLKQQYLDELKRLSNLEYLDEIKIAELKENFNVLNDNPTPSSGCKTKSPFTSLNSFLEETNTFDNSLPEFETFCFDVKEISSGSTTSPPDISLSEYEAFYDDHVKDLSSGSPTTHFDSFSYASFIFDLSINPFPPADRSDFYEFTDELIPFISPLEYDCFLFKVEPNSRDFTKDVVDDISPTKEPQVYQGCGEGYFPTLQLNLKFQPSSEYLFTYVVWIFLPFLVYSVVSHYLLSLRNEDTIFDPGIFNSHFSRPDVSHRCGTFPRFTVLPESPMEIFSST
nr:hypothetical protein [Tanacetum cinerariifolium]